MENRKNYWFPAKAYGLGWGVPQVWQGWAVVAGYAAGIAAAVAFVSPEERPVWFCVTVSALTAALLAVCQAKGEPPKWRWGRK